uniref:Uncharacterized protein n=1 Tax=Arundo donax TaxID=35708 RepID=A0A0A9GL43_ARUDO
MDGNLILFINLLESEAICGAHFQFKFLHVSINIHIK